MSEELSSFESISTEDGSLTLKPQDQESEWMHSLKGAYTETDKVYFAAFNMFLTQFRFKSEPHWGVVGLGMGYIDLGLVLMSLEMGMSQFKLTSFETEPELKNRWTQRIQTGQFSEAYSSHEVGMIGYFRQRFGDQAVKKAFFWLKEALAVGSYEIYNDFKADAHLAQSFDWLAFDAYSNRTQSELWSEEFLTGVCNGDNMKKPSMFVTYAATGNLNRALKANGFAKLNQPGFAGKRESTWALKN